MGFLDLEASERKEGRGQRRAESCASMSRTHGRVTLARPWTTFQQVEHLPTGNLNLA